MNCRLWILSVYVLISDPAGDSVRSYEGLSRESVNSLLLNEGRDFRFITQKEHAAFVNERIESERKVESPARQDAKAAAQVTVRTSTATATSKINALILLLDLDR